MKITHFSFRKAAKLNLGNYSNIEPSMGVDVEIEDGETHEEALAKAEQFVNAALLQQLEPALNEMKPNQRRNWLKLFGLGVNETSGASLLEADMGASSMRPATPKSERSPFSPFQRPAPPLNLLPRELPDEEIEDVPTDEPDIDIYAEGDPEEARRIMEELEADFPVEIDFNDDVPDDGAWNEDETQDAADAPPPELEDLSEFDSDADCDDDELDIHRAENEGMVTPTTPDCWNPDMSVHTLREYARRHEVTLRSGARKEAIVAALRDHCGSEEDVRLIAV